MSPFIGGGGGGGGYRFVGASTKETTIDNCLSLSQMLEGFCCSIQGCLTHTLVVLKVRHPGLCMTYQQNIDSELMLNWELHRWPG